MAAPHPFTGQIQNRNFLSPVGFKFTLAKEPKVAFFCNSAKIPEISLGTHIQPSYLKDIDIPGEKIIYSDLSIKFLVDENMENYMAIHNWVTGLGFPETAKQYQDLITNEDLIKDPKEAFSDGSLYILNSNYNTIATVKFIDLFPISLSSLEFNATANDIQYFTADVSFKYTYYKIKTSKSDIKLIPIVSSKPPTVSLKANKEAYNIGGTVILSWTSTNATSLSINNGVGVLNGSTGSVSVIYNGPITYTITATGPGGTATSSVSLQTLPTSATRLCIAIIDESDSQTTSGMESLWTQFRTTYPNRPFYLLQPTNPGFGSTVTNSNYDTLRCPDNFLNETTVNVSPLI